MTEDVPTRWKYEATANLMEIIISLTYVRLTGSKMTTYEADRRSSNLRMEEKVDKNGSRIELHNLIQEWGKLR